MALVRVKSHSLIGNIYIPAQFYFVLVLKKRTNNVKASITLEWGKGIN